jgi:hypothetical protein
VPFVRQAETYGQPLTRWIITAPTTGYGRFIIAKAVFVAVAAVLALASLVRLRHPAEPGAGLPLATRLEIGALAMVVVVTGLLTVLTPPAKPIYPGSGEGRTGDSGPHRPAPARGGGIIHPSSTVPRAVTTAPARCAS